MTTLKTWPISANFIHAWLYAWLLELQLLSRFCTHISYRFWNIWVKYSAFCCFFPWKKKKCLFWCPQTNNEAGSTRYTVYNIQKCLSSPRDVFDFESNKESCQSYMAMTHRRWVFVMMQLLLPQQYICGASCMMHIVWLICEIFHNRTGKRTFVS